MKAARVLLGLVALLFSSAILAGNPHHGHRDQSPSKMLAALGDQFYLAQANFDPVGNATLVGDNRFDSNLNINIDPNQRTRQAIELQRIERQLRTIRREQLSTTDAVSYDVLDNLLQLNIGILKYPDHLLPLEHMSAMPIVLANLGSGQAEQPLNTVAQYEAYRKRISRLPLWIDQALMNMRKGIRLGIVQSRPIAQAILIPLKQLTNPLDTNPYYAPIRHMPATFDGASKERLKKEYEDTVRTQIIPAMKELVVFVETKYLPASRNTDGWGALPDGASWYKQWINFQTTTDLEPEAIHDLGLQEVARIQGELAKLAPKLGYTGDPKDLLAWVRTNPKYLSFKNETEILDAYRAINERVKPQLPKLFGRMPKAPLDIRPEPELTRDGASDHYSIPAEDGSRPGVFWAVINNPADYNLAMMGSLFLHEGQPGHHFHLALQQEMNLPEFRKRAQINAFAEGWALYAETLGHEMGLYDDPVMYVSNLRLEMMRAVRLVVDTGIHAKGWTHDQAIAYMMKNTGFSEPQARNQIERYMVWPGQALGYKIGALKIQQLRERAKIALGAKFNMAAFHDEVLAEGSLPLSVLEARINHWIEDQRRSL